jgi:hypothetical protein
MDSRNPSFLAIASVTFLAAWSHANGQPKLNAAPEKDTAAFYAVLDDGKRIEPIGVATKGSFPDEANSESGPTPKINARTSFNLIYGGSSIGTATVTSTSKGECSGDSGDISIRPASLKLRGFVMALATNTKPRSKTIHFRRSPTPSERAAAERLVREIYLKEKIPVAATKVLRSHNLTAIDVENDGTAELVGTYIASPKKDERGLLFFIASRKTDGSYGLEHSEFERATSENVMSGDVKDLDDGTVGNELLLDYYDVDGDGTAEIFSTGQAFEGRNFYVYRRASGAWKKIFSSYNYRCGY